MADFVIFNRLWAMIFSSAEMAFKVILTLTSVKFDYEHESINSTSEGLFMLFSVCTKRKNLRMDWREPVQNHGPPYLCIRWSSLTSVIAESRPGHAPTLSSGRGEGVAISSRGGLCGVSAETPSKLEASEACFVPTSEVPVACKSCPCGYIFISRKLLNAKYSEKSPPSTENKHEAKRRRTERVRREKINSTVNKDLENRKRSRSNSHSDHIRRGRGRPKSASAKKHEEEREKQEKEIDIYANLSDEKAFVFSVALAEINRKIINQRLIL
ncbi:UPF0547 protein C16orf87 homolog [Tupaia chinensis]|uniref:UPF0547 protein C16orf87 homolog n=1 Tax=Tupaia chinensis TaxID=246437 RepID=UPI0003C8D541|nr:UPF0547 protein C16orf87 homolog [Tupaia chinensis]